jgi:hypothetical protein
MYPSLQKKLPGLGTSNSAKVLPDNNSQAEAASGHVVMQVQSKAAPPATAAEVAAKLEADDEVQKLIAGVVSNAAAPATGGLAHEQLAFISSYVTEQMLRSDAYHTYCTSWHRPAGCITAMCNLTAHAGMLAAVACDKGSISIWASKATAGAEKFCHELKTSFAASTGTGRIVSLCSLPKNHVSGAALASCESDGTIKLWSLDGVEKVKLQCDGADAAQMIAVRSADGHTLLAACNTHIELWDINTNKHIKWQPGKSS